MNINSLPDKLLCQILSHLPLADLLRLELVCSKWAKLQPIICAQITNLTILVGKDPEKLIEKDPFPIRYHNLLDHTFSLFDRSNYLEFVWLDRKSARWTASLLTNVRSVQVSLRSISPFKIVGEKSRGQKDYILDSIIYLIKSWKFTIEMFKIWISFEFPLSCDLLPFVAPLLNSINNLTSLKHVTFEFTYQFKRSCYYDVIETRIDLQFLEWIEEFNFNFEEGLNHIYSSLTKYAIHNTNLQRISFGCSKQVQFFLREPFFNKKENESLYGKISKFLNAQINEPHIYILEFCAKYTGLVELRIGVPDLVKVYEVLKKIEPLKNLNLLEINFGNTFAFLDINAELAKESTENIPRLESIRAICVEGRVKNHTNLYAIRWEQIFPNLELLHFQMLPRPCQDCYPNDSEMYRQKFKECYRLSMRAWKSCSKLMTIITGRDREQIQWNVKELFQ